MGLQTFVRPEDLFDTFWGFRGSGVHSGKSKWGLSKWGLKVLVHNCPRLPAIVVIL